MDHRHHHYREANRGHRPDVKDRLRWQFRIERLGLLVGI